MFKVLKGRQIHVDQENQAHSIPQAEFGPQTP